MSNWPGTKIRIKDGWEAAGCKGECVGEPIFIKQLWLPVVWGNAEDPELFKLAGIEKLI